MNTDATSEAHGVRLTVPEVKRLARKHGRDMDDTQALLASLEASEDGTYSATVVLSELGY